MNRKRKQEREEALRFHAIAHHKASQYAKKFAGISDGTRREIYEDILAAIYEIEEVKRSRTE